MTEFALVTTALVAVWGAIWAAGTRPKFLSAVSIVFMMYMLYIVYPAAYQAFFRTESFWARDAFLAGADRTAALLAAFWLAVFGFAVAVSQPKAGARAAREMDIRVLPLGRLSKLLFKYRTHIIVLILSLLLIRLVSFYASGGFTTSVLRMSEGVSRNMNIGNVESVYLMLRNISVAADILCAFLLTLSFYFKRQRLFYLTLFGASIISLYVFVGKRSVILLPLTIVILYFAWSWRGSLARYLAATCTMVFVGFFSLLYRVYAPASLANVNIDLRGVQWARGNVWEFYFNSGEFAAYEMIATSVAYRDDIIQKFGSLGSLIYSVHVEPFLYVIPRVIFPSKPLLFRDISHAIKAFNAGLGLDMAPGGTASTVIGTSYISASVFGVVLSAAVLGVLSQRVDRWFRNRSAFSVIQLGWYALAIVVAFHLFRQGTFGWVFIIAIVENLGAIVVLIGLAALAYLTKRRQRSSFV